MIGPIQQTRKRGTSAWRETNIKRRTGASRPATVPTMFGFALHSMLAVVYLTSIGVSGSNVGSTPYVRPDNPDNLHVFFGTIFRNPLVAIATTTPILTEPFEPDPEADARFNGASEFVYDSVKCLQRTGTVPSYFDEDARRHLSSLSPNYFSPDRNDRIDQVDVFFAYRNLLDFTLKRFSLDDNSIDFTLQSVVHCNQCGYTERLDQRISKLVMTESISNPSKFFDCEYVVPKQSACQRCESTGQSYCVGRLDGSPAMLFVKIPKDRKDANYQIIESSFKMHGNNKYVLRAVIADYEKVEETEQTGKTEKAKNTEGTKVTEKIEETEETEEAIIELYTKPFTIKYRDGVEGNVDTVITYVVSGEGLKDPDGTLKTIQRDFRTIPGNRPRVLIYVLGSYISNLPPTIRLPPFHIEDSLVETEYPELMYLVDEFLPSRIQMIYEFQNEKEVTIQVPSDDEADMALIELMPYLLCVLHIVPKAPFNIDSFLSRVICPLRDGLPIDRVDLFNVFFRAVKAADKRIQTIQRLIDLLPRADLEEAGVNGIGAYSAECRCCYKGFCRIPSSAVEFDDGSFVNPDILANLIRKQFYIKWERIYKPQQISKCKCYGANNRLVEYHNIIRLSRNCIVLNIGINSNRDMCKLRQENPTLGEIIPCELTKAEAKEDRSAVNAEENNDKESPIQIEKEKNSEQSIETKNKHKEKYHRQNYKYKKAYTPGKNKHIVLPEKGDEKNESSAKMKDETVQIKENGSLIRVEDQKYGKLAAFMLQTKNGDLVPYLQSGKGEWYKMKASGSINLVSVTKDKVKSLLNGRDVPGGPRYLFYCNQDNPDSPVNRNSN